MAVFASQPRPIPITAWRSRTTVVTADVTDEPLVVVERFPVTAASAQPSPDARRGHLVVDVAECGERLRRNAAVLVWRCRSAPFWEARNWLGEVLRDHPRCMASGAVLSAERCLIAVRSPDADAPEAHEALMARVDPGPGMARAVENLASAVYAWVTAQHGRRDWPPLWHLDLGGPKCTAHLTRIG